VVAAEVTIPAGGGPPAMHRHPSAELYRVDRGELALYLGDERISAGEGAVVHIPGGTAHTIRNETDAEAQAFVVFTPGTEMERFVRAVAASPGDVLALAREHGIEMLTP
jgi:mannose-6-phosphate isomerase-like protein (cupin superfamily)